MKRHIKKWTLRLALTGMILAGVLLIIILNPILIYANQTNHNNYVIYHNKTITSETIDKLDEANEIIKTSEFFNPDLRLKICLNDGSKYPKIIQAILGQAFANGFYNIVVFQGQADFINNYVELHGYRWDLTQLLAHEIIHCIQFNKLGFWQSNPVAKIPNWKWEGYAEYISRQTEEPENLKRSIEQLLRTDKNNWAVTYSDSTIAPKEYHISKIMVQYSIDIKNMTYTQLLADTTSEEIIKQEMMAWFSRQK